MNKKIRSLVIDNDPYALQIMEDYIGKSPNLELVGLCQNPLEALALMLQEKVELIFLDIEMSQLNGIDLLKALQQKPMIIFTTDDPSYALQGYQLDVVDYLLKPFGFERFLQAIIKANRRSGKNLFPHKSKSNLTGKAQVNSVTKDYLLVKSEHKLHRIRYDQILYIQGMKEYVAFYLNSGRIFSLLSLKSLEKILPKDQFLRIHKSYIVSIDKVSTLEGNQVHICSNKIPIGLSYKGKVLGQLFQ